MDRGAVSGNRVISREFVFRRSRYLVKPIEFTQKTETENSLFSYSDVSFYLETSSSNPFDCFELDFV